jgi:hypothetical protein
MTLMRTSRSSIGTVKGADDWCTGDIYIDAVNHAMSAVNPA